MVWALRETGGSMNKTMAIVAILMFGTLAGSTAAEKLYVSYEIDPDSVFLYTSAQDLEVEASMATMSYGETIWRLDLETGKYREVGKFHSSRSEEKPIGDAAHNRLFRDDNTVLELDTMTRKTLPIQVSNRGLVVSPDGRNIYANYMISAAPYREGTAMIDG